MRFIKFSIYSLAVSVVLAGLNQTSVSAFTLDLFTDANDEIAPGEFLQQVDVSRTNLSGSDLDTNLSGTDLGQRNLEITLESGSRRSGFINVDTFLGEGSVASNPGTTIETAKFTWGSDSTTPLDITDNGANDPFDSFLIDVVSIDLAGATFTFSVEDGDNDVGSISQPVNSIGEVYFPYETLTTNFPNVDQTRIREVGLEITNAPADFDASFDFIESATQPVPFEFSPSLGLIFCGGLFGVNKLRKRKASQA